MHHDDRHDAPLAPPDAPAYRVPSDFDHEAPPARRDEPAVLVVKERPAQGAALLLPPLLIVTLGAGFLAYRSRASDWRGVSALFESATAPTVVARVDPPARPDLRAPAVEAPAAAPEAGAEPAPAPGPDAPAIGPLPAPEPTPAAEATPKAPDKADDAVTSDIEAEAEKTREKIAALEKLKEEEAKNLAETEADRREADRRAQRLPRFGFQGIPPEEIDRLVRGQRDQFRRMMERQVRDMAEMQRRFLRDGFDSPDPNDWPPRFVIPGPPPEVPLLPRAGRPGAARPGDRTIRTPDGGIARFRQFRGPNGMQQFEWRWESQPGRPGVPRFAPADPDDDPDDVPPPPRPAAPRRRID